VRAEGVAPVKRQQPKPSDKFDPVAARAMKRYKAVGQQEGAADRNQGRRTRLSVDGANRIRR
jgi:hypothetical protein